MSLSLKQYVPSRVCLACDGCCRFDAADSPWRPRTHEGYLQTIQDCGKHLCQFFNKADGTCRTYLNRPFECALYPFILSQTQEGIKVFVHLACPHIQDTQASVELKEYIHYLQVFFNDTKTRDFLKANHGLLHNYTPQEIELQYLFTIEGFTV